MDNARNTDGTPFLGVDGGASAGQTSRTPAQRRQDARAYVEIEAGAGMLRMINAQRARIDKLEKRIAELRDRIQERDDGVSNLGMRLSRLEDGFAEFRARVIAAVPSVGKRQEEGNGE